MAVSPLGARARFVMLCVATCLVTLAPPVRADDRGIAAADASAASDSPDKSGYDLFNPTPDDQLRKFAPDRPAKGFSVRTIDAGHFQIETDFVNYTYSNAGGVGTRGIQALDPVWKLGLTNWADFELQFNGTQASSSLGNASGALLARGSGFGDVFLRTKINLLGNDGGMVGFAIIPYVKLPSSTAIISNGVVEGGLIAPLALRLPQDFLVTLMTEVDALKDADDSRRYANFVNLVGVAHPVPGIDGVNAIAEIYSSMGTDRATPPVYTFDMGLTYLLAKNVMLDIGLNVGLNKAAPKEQIYTGISARF
jgi:Putative MetA-pathway of phenol degradation